MLLGCAIFFVFAADSGSTNINIDIDAASWPVLVGWFLVADGLLSFMGGLIYLMVKVPRLGTDGAVAELRSRERANLSAVDNRAAEDAIQALYARTWRRGVIFMVSGGVSLVVAILILNGVIRF